jgi:hypothetical protein
VIAKAETTVTIPVGPNKPNGEGGLEALKFTNGNATVSPIRGRGIGQGRQLDRRAEHGDCALLGFGKNRQGH